MDAANPRHDVVVIRGTQSTEIPDRMIVDAFKIYPNPASDELYVEIPPGLINEAKSISISGMDGRILIRNELIDATLQPVILSLESSSNTSCNV